MILKVYAVFDSAVGAYMQPFFMQSKGAALRAWLEAANDEKTQFHKHPGDFTLFELGEYDELTGTFTNHTAKMSLGTALEHKSSSAFPRDGLNLAPRLDLSSALEKHSERTTQ